MGFLFPNPGLLLPLILAAAPSPPTPAFVGYTIGLSHVAPIACFTSRGWKSGAACLDILPAAGEIALLPGGRVRFSGRENVSCNREGSPIRAIRIGGPDVEDFGQTPEESALAVWPPSAAVQLFDDNNKHASMPFAGSPSGSSPEVMAVPRSLYRLAKSVGASEAVSIREAWEAHLDLDGDTKPDRVVAAELNEGSELPRTILVAFPAEGEPRVIREVEERGSPLRLQAILDLDHDGASELVLWESTDAGSREFVGRFAGGRLEILGESFCPGCAKLARVKQAAGTAPGGTQASAQVVQLGADGTVTQEFECVPGVARWFRVELPPWNAAFVQIEPQNGGDRAPPFRLTGPDGSRVASFPEERWGRRVENREDRPAALFIEVRHAGEGASFPGDWAYSCDETPRKRCSLWVKVQESPEARAQAGALRLPLPDAAQRATVQAMRKLEELVSSMFPGFAADRGLEGLALSLSPGFGMDQAIYGRIVADVALIQALEPATRAIAYRALAEPDKIDVEADTESLDQGLYSAWDALNDTFGAKPERYIKSWRLVFSAPWNVARVAARYSALPGIKATTIATNAAFNAGTSIEVCAAGERWYYDFVKVIAGPSGGHGVTSYSFRTLPGGRVERLTGSCGSEAGRPPWCGESAAACQRTREQAQ